MTRDPSELEYTVATRLISRGNTRGRKRKSGCGTDTPNPTVKPSRPRDKIQENLAPNLNSAATVMTGVEKCFLGAKKGANRRTKTAIDRRSYAPSTPSVHDVTNFQRSLTKFDSIIAEASGLRQSYIEKSHHISWLLQLGYNILFFGIGSKGNFVEDISKLWLSGEDVIVIDVKTNDSSTRRSNKAVKSLLNTICHGLLRKPELPGSLPLQTMTEIVCDWLNSHYGREKIPSRSNFGATYIDSAVDDGTSSISTASRRGDAVDKQTDGSLAVKIEVVTESSSSRDSARPEIAASEPLWIETTTDLCHPAAKRLPTRLAAVPSVSSHGLANSRWGGRYQHAQSKLYIIVDPIDSEALSSIESQACLATLASCASVSIIAVSDGVNFPVIWSEEISEKFNWTYHHVPTYTSFGLEIEASEGDKESSTISAKVFSDIVKSLTLRHRQVIKFLAEDALEYVSSQETAGTPGDAEAPAAARQWKGMLFDDLLRQTKSTLTARTNTDLSNILRELFDHKIASAHYDAKRNQVILLNVSIETLRQYVLSE